MSRRICLLLSVIFLVPLNQAISQEGLRDLAEEVSIIAHRNALGGLTYERIEGSPYYTEDFIDGEVHLRNGNSASLPLRYDIFQDEIEFKSENQILWLKKQNIEYLTLGDEKLVLEPVAVGSSGFRKIFSLYKEKSNFRTICTARGIFRGCTGQVQAGK
jgi:hypothetical protein